MEMKGGSVVVVVGGGPPTPTIKGFLVVESTSGSDMFGKLMGCCCDETFNARSNPNIPPVDPIIIKIRVQQQTTAAAVDRAMILRPELVSSNKIPVCMVWTQDKK